ncbi:hypothetical protein CAP48_10375 [Advenella sp. S44]|nr:hypothetical protein CAP48_10375 [Advenella sp. S44]
MHQLCIGCFVSNHVQKKQIPSKMPAQALSATHAPWPSGLVAHHWLANRNTICFIAIRWPVAFSRKPTNEQAADKSNTIHTIGFVAIY